MSRFFVGLNYIVYCTAASPESHFYINIKLFFYKVNYST